MIGWGVNSIVHVRNNRIGPHEFRQKKELFHFNPQRQVRPITIRFLTLPFYHWIMSGLHGFSLLLLCIMLVIIAGCASPAIDEARYYNGNIIVNLSSSDNSADARIQVTIYQIRDLHQNEYRVVYAPVLLTKGQNQVFIPVSLEPGSYKLYIYLILNGERKTAVIRDIVV